MSRSLIGKAYGDLKVVEYIGNKKYLCECKCGKRVEHFSANLHGHMSCPDCSPVYRKSLIGNEYGYLKVIAYDKPSRKWVCECKCKALIKVKSNNLKSGNTASCGRCKSVELAQRDIVNGTRLSQLKSKTRSDNTSGIKGVSYNTRRNKWVAYIRFCGTNYFLGYHDTLELATLARATAEEKLHGDFINWYNEYRKQTDSGYKAGEKEEL